MCKSLDLITDFEPSQTDITSSVAFPGIVNADERFWAPFLWILQPLFTVTVHEEYYWAITLFICLLEWLIKFSIRNLVQVGCISPSSIPKTHILQQS